MPSFGGISGVGVDCRACFACASPLGFWFEYEASIEGGMCRLHNVALRTLKRSWSKVLVKSCMQCLYVSGIVHHGGRGVIDRGPVESETCGVTGLFVYMTQ